MKSMQLLWQSSPVTNEEDEVLQEKESARQDCSIDPALAKEICPGSYRRTDTTTVIG